MVKHSFPRGTTTLQIAGKINAAFAYAEAHNYREYQLYNLLSDWVHYPLHEVYPSGGRKHTQHLASWAEGYARAKLDMRGS